VNPRSFFSISYDLIILNKKVPFDLFVNASSVEKRQKFVRIFPQGDTLTLDDLSNFRKKYLQMYVAEDQRNLYMRSLVQSDDIGDKEAITFIKDSAIQYLHSVFDPKKEFSTELLYETIKGCKEAVENMIDVLDDYNIDGLRALIGDLSGHDFYTYDHSINVSMYSLTVLRALKPNATRAELLHAGLGGLLHDLGKVKIPTEILNKPEGLTEGEYQIIKTHPDLGLNLILENEDMDIEGLDLKTIARIIHEHHENWAGDGYPSKLKEKEIHLLARVCAIADFFDAITTKRSYSEVVSVSQGIAIMEKTAGKKLDPRIFNIFADHVGHSKALTTKQLQMNDSFDPSIPYATLPLEEIEEMFAGDDFGKIRMIDKNENESKKKTKKKE
jgi:HD-GYP domain-containing protein (c-di-GMP phosphodiesterase class II)